MAFKKDKGRLRDVVVNVDPNADSAAGAKLPPPPGADANRSQAWNASKGGISHAWTSYRQNLADSFKTLSRFQQEALINRLCQIITIGVTLLALLLFYHLMPLAVRVIVVPLAVVGGWWASNNVVTPVVVDRMEPVLQSRDNGDQK